MSAIRKRLLKKFRDRDYRHSYLESFLNSVISSQIRALREREGLSQRELAELIGTRQSVISRIESPEYSGWSVDTLRKIARALDMALAIKFVSHGEALEDVEQFAHDGLMRPAFKDDPVFTGVVESGRNALRLRIVRSGDAETALEPNPVEPTDYADSFDLLQPVSAHG